MLPAVAEAPPLFEIEVYDGPKNQLYTSMHYLGPYISAKFQWCWAVPAMATFTLPADHPDVPLMLSCRRRVIPIRTFKKGKAWDGRVMNTVIEGEPGKETVTVTCMSNLFWLLTVLAWVNPILPPVFQIALTGKQDIMFGPIDFVFKWFLGRNVIRQGKPVYMGLPLRTAVAQPNLNDVNSIDDLLDMVNGIDLIALSARFTQMDELYKQTVATGEIGLDMDLWVRGDTAESPKVFNTDGLSYLQSILDFGSDNFLNFTNPGNALGLGDPNSWNKINRDAGYIFNTRQKRDRRWQVWSTDSGQIQWYKRSVVHPTATRAIVGGQAPQVVNQIVEFAANLAIQAIAGAITALFGLPGVGAIAVGNIFDDIFFAFQEFADYDLEAELGIHHFRETLADNTAAWNLDSFGVGMNALIEKGGSDDIKMKIITGGPNDRGMQFGLDTDIVNGVAVDRSRTRFLVGDIVNFHDRGQYVPNYISAVDCEDTRGGRMIETVTLGEDERLKSAWGLIIDRLKGFAGITRALAVQG